MMFRASKSWGGLVFVFVVASAVAWRVFGFLPVLVVACAVIPVLWTLLQYANRLERHDMKLRKRGRRS